MKGKYVLVGTIAAAVGAGLGVTSLTQADPKKAPKVPVLQVDTSFPKPLPNSHSPFTSPQYKDMKSSATGDYMPWVTGEVAGTCIDSQDHVFTVNRGNLVNPEGTAATTPPTPILPLTAVPSPTVIEYDSAGNVVNACSSSQLWVEICRCDAVFSRWPSAKSRRQGPQSRPRLSPPRARQWRSLAPCSAAKVPA